MALSIARQFYTDDLVTFQAPNTLFAFAYKDTNSTNSQNIALLLGMVFRSFSNSLQYTGFILCMRLTNERRSYNV